MLQDKLARSFWRGIGDIKDIEDMTSLYRKQAVMFQRSCEQIRDVYRVDPTPNQTHKPNEVSPFGTSEYSAIKRKVVQQSRAPLSMDAPR